MQNRRRSRWLFLGAVLVVATLASSCTTSARADQAGDPSATVEATPSPTPLVYPTFPVDPDYPGAAWLMAGGDAPLPDVPYKPNGNVSYLDKPVTYATPANCAEDPVVCYCHQGESYYELKTCEFGPENAKHTIALVGWSHAAHWQPALAAIADAYGFRIINVTRGSCQFATFAPGQENSLCIEWNRRALAYLLDSKPDLVVTVITRGRRAGTDFINASTIYPPLQALDAAGIPVFALRDGPWWGSEADQPPGCVVRRGPDDLSCGTTRKAHGLDVPLEQLVIDAGEPLPANVHLFDPTDFYCDPVNCPAVVGNVLVYRDDHHFSRTFATTMGPYLGRAIVDAMGWTDW